MCKLGSGPNHTPSEWIKSKAEQGGGIGHGFVTARSYLRPAVEEHVEEYRRIVENEKRNA